MKKDLKEAILSIEITQFDGQKSELDELVNPRQLEEIIDDWMPEVLSWEWILEKRMMGTYQDANGRLMSYFALEDLENLLVPKQEEVDRAYNDGYEKGKQYTFYKGYLEGLADKESEPEVLSQEWVAEHEMPITWMAKEQKVVRVENLQNLLVPKRELPVIPKRVADYIEECKRFDESGRKSLYTAMDSMPKEAAEWMTFDVEGFGKGQELFARAWIDGFTIANEEEEQKYYVLNKNNKLMLRKYTRGVRELDISNSMSIDSEFFEFERFALTEQEIKDYDERYWTFAKPVEEVEE